MSIDLTPDQMELVLFLIKVDMKNHRFLLSLENAGIVSDEYYTDICNMIFKLMSIEENERDEKLYEIYDTCMEGLPEIKPYEFSDQLNMLALNLYTELLTEKKLRKIQKTTRKPV